MTLVRTPDDEPAYFVSVVQDISIHKQAEARANACAQELKTVLTAAPAAIWVAHDAQCRELIGNPFASEVLRIPDPNANLSKSANDPSAVAHFKIINTEGNELETDDLPAQRAARGEIITDFEERLVFEEGSEIWLFGAARPLFSSSSKIRWSVAAFVDITARKKGEERERLLTREVDHRAKNIMAIVQAILRLTRADTVEAYRIAVEARISSLARTHSLLAENRWDGADLRNLLLDELTPYAGLDTPHRVKISGPDVKLLPDAAQSTALLVHELVTNAVKYGALSVPGGRVDVIWSVKTEGSSHKLAMDWREEGGPIVSEPRRQGFGLTLIRSTVESQLDGFLSERWAESGLQVGVSFPLDGRTSHGGSISDITNPMRQSTVADGRILILEDEPLIALQIANEVESAGYMVAGPVHTQAEALALIEKQNIAWAVLDIRLSSGTSEAVADALLVRDIPFVFCSVFANAATLPDRLDVIPRLAKPLETGSILRALRWMTSLNERQVSSLPQ